MNPPIQRAIVRGKSRIFVVLALLVGSLSIVSVSQAQPLPSPILSGLLGSGTGAKIYGKISTVLAALEAEAEETGTNPAAVADLPSDISYAEYYLNSPGGSYSITGAASKYYAVIVPDVIPLMSGSAALVDSGTISTVFSNFMPDSTKADLAYFLTGADLTGGNSDFYSAIGPMAAAVAATLSRSDLATYAPLIGELATYPIIKNSSASTLEAEYFPSIANDIATSSTALTVTEQAGIAGYVAVLVEKSALAVAITTATTVEQTVLTAEGPSQDATVAGIFSSNPYLLSLAPYLGALAAAQPGADIAAVSGSTADASPKFYSGIAYQIALATGTANAATVAGAVAGSTAASSDGAREYVANTVIAAQPSEDAAVAAAVAPHLSDTDKEILAYLISDQDLGLYNVESTTLNQPGDIGPAAAAIAVQVSSTESTYGSVSALIAEYAAIPFLKDTSASTLEQEYLPGLAYDVAMSSTNETLADQALIATDVALLVLRSDPTLVATIVKTVEDCSLSGGGPPHRPIVAATYAAAIPLEAVVSASNAAMGQSPELSGSIGAAVAIAGTVPKYGAQGAIALAVAEAATLPNGEDLNDALYDTAEAFGAVSSQLGGNTNIFLVAKALAGATTGYSATHAPEENDAIPAIVSAFTSQMGSSSYIATLVELIVYYYPGDACDILGAVLATLPGNASVTPATLKADVIAFAEATNLLGLEGLTGTGTKPAAFAAVSGSVGAAYTLATGTSDPYIGLTPDETPIIDL
ncbi:MAG: hypothetical protein ABSE62_14830 [Chthoniobacteraceae bacterium]|jgi:hypothetical protein